MKDRKLVCGMGINNADYVIQKNETIVCVNGKRKQKQVWRCKYYETWVGMLKRCYSTKQKKRDPSYNGCSASTEWLTFSNFKSWMEKQDWEGKQIDKDLLFEGNKIYSADTCIFVSQLVNSFIIDSKSSRGDFPLGVCWHKKSGKFQAQCGNPLTKKIEYLGLFTCEQQAHSAWLNRKLELARLLAAEQTDPRIAKALIERYSRPYADKVLK